MTNPRKLHLLDLLETNFVVPQLLGYSGIENIGTLLSTSSQVKEGILASASETNFGEGGRMKFIKVENLSKWVKTFTTMDRAGRRVGPPSLRLAPSTSYSQWLDDKVLSYFLPKLTQLKFVSFEDAKFNFFQFSNILPLLLTLPNLRVLNLKNSFYISRSFKSGVPDDDIEIDREEQDIEEEQNALTAILLNVLQNLSSLQELNIIGCQNQLQQTFINTILESLGNRPKFKGLKRLNFEYPIDLGHQFRSYVLDHLSMPGFKNLEHLHIDYESYNSLLRGSSTRKLMQKLSDACTNLISLELAHFDLNEVEVDEDDQTLTPVKALHLLASKTNLRSLHLKRSRFKDSWCSELHQLNSFKNLEELKITQDPNYYRVTQLGLGFLGAYRLVQSTPLLKYLKLSIIKLESLTDQVDFETFMSALPVSLQHLSISIEIRRGLDAESRQKRYFTTAEIGYVLKILPKLKHLSTLELDLDPLKVEFRAKNLGDLRKYCKSRHITLIEMFNIYT